MQADDLGSVSAHTHTVSHTHCTGLSLWTSAVLSDLKQAPCHHPENIFRRSLQEEDHKVVPTCLHYFTAARMENIQPLTGSTL